HGLEYMFTMMNPARLNVGLEGVAVAQAAYQKAVAYARTRVQGKPIGGSERASRKKWSNRAISKARPWRKPSTCSGPATWSGRTTSTIISRAKSRCPSISWPGTLTLETAVGRCEVHSVSEISRLGCIRLGRGGAGRGGGVR